MIIFQTIASYSHFFQAQSVDVNCLAVGVAFIFHTQRIIISMLHTDEGGGSINFFFK